MRSNQDSFAQIEAIGFFIVEDTGVLDENYRDIVKIKTPFPKNKKDTFRKKMFFGKFIITFNLTPFEKSLHN